MVGSLCPKRPHCWEPTDLSASPAPLAALSRRGGGEQQLSPAAEAPQAQRCWEVPCNSPLYQHAAPLAARYREAKNRVVSQHSFCTERLKENLGFCLHGGASPNALVSVIKP